MGRDAKDSQALRACEARATLEDHSYGASSLPKQPKTTVLQSRVIQTLIIIDPTMFCPEYFWISLNIRVAKKSYYNRFRWVRAPQLPYAVSYEKI